MAMNTHMMPHPSRKEERVVMPDTTFMSSPLTSCASCQQVPDLDFSCRAHAKAPSDIIALDGMLELPQSFGTINLGEVCNPVAEYQRGLCPSTPTLEDCIVSPRMSSSFCAADPCQLHQRGQLFGEHRRKCGCEGSPSALCSSCTVATVLIHDYESMNDRSLV